MSTTPSWLDRFFIAARVKANGTPLEQRLSIDFGSGLLAVDVPGEDLIRVTAPPQGGGDFYGSGVDGAVTLSGNTTLTADKFYTTLDLAGFTLKTGGFRIFCKTSLAMNGGTIACDGTVGVNGPTPNPATNGAPAATLGGGKPSGGLSGISAATNTVSGFGGSGGLGGSAYTNTSSAPIASYPPVKGPPYQITQALVGLFIDGAKVMGGAGGGAGVGSTNNEKSEGGGGGGVVLVAAKVITGPGTIQALGGPGGSPLGPGTNAGSGGGGGGGVVFLVHNGALPGTLTVSVAGGAGGGNAFGNGVNGLPGDPGKIVAFVL